MEVEHLEKFTTSKKESRYEQKRKWRLEDSQLRDSQKYRGATAFLKGRFWRVTRFWRSWKWRCQHHTRAHTHTPQESYLCLSRLKTPWFQNQHLFHTCFTKAIPEARSCTYLSERSKSLRGARGVWGGERGSFATLLQHGLLLIPSWSRAGPLARMLKTPLVR